MQTLLIVVAAGITCVNAGTNGNGHIQIKESSPSYVPNRCLLDPVKGPCYASIRQYYFNTATGHCQEFTYGGCQGNSNRFQTYAECQRSCACKASSETGPCRGHIRRWFYSPKDGVCRPFVFGGCGGNSNNYGSWYECSSACGYPDPNNSWWKWWTEQGGRDWGTGVTKSGYSEADFMKDYMMLGMVGELELEGLQDIVNLYMQLQSMGGLSTMKSGSRSGMGSNFGASRTAGARATGLGLANWGEGEANGEGYYGNLGAGSAAFGSIMGEFGSNGDAEHGRSRQFGRQQLGMGVAQGGSRAGAGGYTPLGYRGSGSYTPVGEMGSVANYLGTGTSNMAQEMKNLRSALDSYGLGEANFNFGSFSTGHGWAPTGGLDIIKFIKHLAVGRITPRDMKLMAHMLGAMDNTGKIDINIMLTQLSKSLSNLGMASNQNLKGVAQGFGALDLNGNINMNRLLQSIARSMAGIVSQMSRVWGSSGSLPTHTGPTVTNFIRFIEHLGSGKLSRADMTNMAKMLGVLNNRGQIDVNVMAQRLMNALSNPGIAADLKGTARRFGAIDRNGNINIQIFLRRIAGSMGSPLGEMGRLGSEILNFLTKLATGRTSHQDLKVMARKLGAVDGAGNINLGVLGKGIAGALSSQSTTADLKGVASQLGALNTDGNININLLLKGVSGALKGALGGMGGPLGGAWYGVGGVMGGIGGNTGSADRTREAFVVGRSGIK